MKLAICYFSVTGRTKAMAEAMAKGAEKEGVQVRAISIEDMTPENVAFINDCQGVIFGTPDYYAAEAWQMKQFLDTCPCKLAGKLGGAFATANKLVGGPDVAIVHILTHVMVQGMMVYSGGAAFGEPYIHLGPVCFRDMEEQGAELMEIFGNRFVSQMEKIFKA